MIVKKVKNKKTAKTKARQIADLVDYIRCPQGMNPAEKIEHSGGLNFLSRTHTGQRLEMISLATETVHSKMPVSHFVFSWREYEQPTAEQVDELVDIFLQEMGLEGCQTVYGLHWNTENYHVHIAVNRMHPLTMKVIAPNHGFDIEAAHKVLALVEHRQGWSREANARYTVSETGDIVPRPKRNAAPKPKPPALDFERATGEKSAQRIAQERGHAIIQDAKSWAELHAMLASVGLRFERKGSGAILFVGAIAVKASSVARAFSMGKLCKRLGEFVPGSYPQEPMELAPEPVSPINLRQWQQYRAECGQETPPTSPTQADSKITLLKEKHHQERATLHTRLGKHPRCILTIARHCLKLQQQEEMQQLRRRVKKRPRSGHQGFEDWLRERGLHQQADRWRHRQALEALPLEFRGTPTVMATPKREPLASYATHKRAMLKAVPDAEFDRLTMYITLLMRKEGFLREVVEDAIYHCAPEDWPEQPERDWRRYAERMAACAFGVEGDLRLARGSAAEKKQRQEQEKGDNDDRQEETPRQAPSLRMR